MAKIRIPLAGSIVRRLASIAADLDRDQRFVNCFPSVVKNSITGAERIYLERRSGIEYTTTAAVGAVGLTGACVWQSHSVSTQIVFPFRDGNSTSVMYTVNENGVQLGTAITSTGSCGGITDIGSINGTSYVAGMFQGTSASLSSGWYLPQGGNWTNIASANFPPNQSPARVLTFSAPVAMDGFLFWMTTDGRIYNSQLNTVSTYTANGYITANSLPDGGTGLARSGKLIVAFGKYSIEFFRNAGNESGSPLVSHGEAIRIGKPLTNPTKQIGGRIYFLGVDPESGRHGIYRLSGTSIQKISTPEVDETISDGFAVSATAVGALKMRGMEHVLFAQSITGGNIHAFCEETGQWWRLDPGNGSVIMNALCTGNEKTYFNELLSNRIASMTYGSTSFSDGGTSATMTVQMQALDFGSGSRKIADRLYLFGDKANTTAPVSVSWSDDDGSTFSTPINIDMSSANPYITRLGAFRRRVFKITTSSAAISRLEAVELELRNGQT